MNALGTTAFDPQLTPEYLYRASVEAQSVDNELGEELAEFAADFATIRNLPELAAVQA